MPLGSRSILDLSPSRPGTLFRNQILNQASRNFNSKSYDFRKLQTSSMEHRVADKWFAFSFF